MIEKLTLSYYHKQEGKTPLPGWVLVENDIVEIVQKQTNYISLKSTLCGREYGLTIEYFNKLKKENNENR